MKPTHLILIAGLLGGVACRKAGHDQPAELRIVKKSLWHKGDSFEVRGTIHNPRATPAEVVKIAVEFMATDLLTEGSKELPIGVKTATIDYLPPGASVDFQVSMYVRDGDDKYVTTGAVKISEK